jgi:hypothetical protein
MISESHSRGYGKTTNSHEPNYTPIENKFQFHFRGEGGVSVHRVASGSGRMCLTKTHPLATLLAFLLLKGCREDSKVGADGAERRLRR